MLSIACEKLFALLLADGVAQNPAKQPDVFPERQILVAQARLVHRERFRATPKIATRRLEVGHSPGLCDDRSSE